MALDPLPFSSVGGHDNEVRDHRICVDRRSFWGSTFSSKSSNNTKVCYGDVVKTSCLSKLLLAFMFIWLPVSGTVGAVMPLSSVMKKQAGLSLQAQADSSVSDEEPPAPCHGDIKKSTRVQSCSHCAVCHLTASTTFEVRATPFLPLGQVFSAAFDVADLSFIPDLPIPPPRLSLA